MSVNILYLWDKFLDLCQTDNCVVLVVLAVTVVFILSAFASVIGAACCLVARLFVKKKGVN